MQKDPLFFIALLPPAPIQATVTEFKEIAARKFGSRHALKSPPHITLQAPFRFSLKKIKTLKTTLADFARHRAPFEVRLRGWDHFADRVIFIDVEPNECMSDLQYSLTTLLHEKFAIPKDRRPWHPHMTVAFKDLLPARFPRAWAYFSDISFARDFVPAGLTLLLHRDGRWHVFDTFEWGNP